jgi:hypothetical protein
MPGKHKISGQAQRLTPGFDRSNDVYLQVFIMKILLVSVVILISMVNQGCTRQAWFEGLKSRERQECYKNPSNSDVKNYMENIDNTKIEEAKK